MSEDWLDELSLAVADGEPVDTASADLPVDGPQARTAARLGELASLHRLFVARAAGALAPEPVCPFPWGRLEVREVIGQGSFARVYRAYDPVLDRDVALKLFRRDREDLDADQLIEEARRHARVHHPRVLAVHGADVVEGIAGLWTDLLRGQTLADRIGREGPFAGPRLRNLARDLAAGLAAVHDEGIVHGDLKPANVWIDERGRAILMDFGAAESIAGDRPARYGSPVTMAPELFAGGAHTPASDTFAVGAVLHFAATGSYPVPGASLAEIRAAWQKLGEPDFRRLREAAKAEAPLVASLLARAPAERPRLEEIAARLDALDAAPQRRLRRRALAAVIGSLAIGLVVALVGLDRSTRAREAAEVARLAAERARFEAQTSQAFLIESVGRMSPEAAQGLGTVKAVLEFLAEFGDERLAETPLARGELMVVVGSRLTHFEEVDRGLALARDGIALIEATDPGASAELARAYGTIAEAERQLARYEVARDDVLIALGHLAKLEKTEDIRYQAIQLRGTLVALLEALGQWSAGLAAQRAQLAERAALVGENDSRMAVEYNNLGQSLMLVGRNEEALEAFRRAMALLEADETPRPFPEAIVNEAIASALMNLGRFDESREAIANTRRRFEALGLDPKDDRFHRLERLEAGILRRNGEHRRALAIYERLLAAGAQPYTERMSRVRMAGALLELDRSADALEQLRQARAAYAWPPEHPEQRYLDAAIAYAEAEAAGEPGAAREVLAETLAWYEAQGIEGSAFGQDLQRWLRGRRTGPASEP